MAVVARGAIMRERVVSSLFSLHSGPLCSTIFSSNSTIFSQILEHVSCSGYTRAGTVDRVQVVREVVTLMSGGCGRAPPRGSRPRTSLGFKCSSFSASVYLKWSLSSRS